MNSFHQYQHAHSHAPKADGLHPDASKPWNRPDSQQKSEEQEQVDCGASPGSGEVVRD